MLDVATGHPLWRSPLLLADPPELPTHRGWIRLGTPHADPTPSTPNDPAWRRAAVDDARLGGESPDHTHVCLVSLGDELSLWSKADGRKLWSRPAADVAGLLATDAGCLVRADGGAAPASAVRRMVEGPSGTLIAGYADGSVVVWDLGSGKSLHRTAMHGPIEHLVLRGATLYAASERGGHETIDLHLLAAPYRDVMRELWAMAPAVWSDGRATVRPPPPGHACATRP